jgi:hypothetical protein
MGRPKPQRDEGAPSEAHPGALPVPAAFKMTFLAVLGLTVLSMAVSIALVFYGHDTDQAKHLAETCSTTYKLGFGAILGLLGGKAL